MNDFLLTQQILANCSREKLATIETQFNSKTQYLTFKSFTSEGVPLFSSNNFMLHLYTPIVAIGNNTIDYKNGKFTFYFDLSQFDEQSQRISEVNVKKGLIILG